MSGLGGLVDAFGPFLIPIVVFVLGLVGYGLLLLLYRLLPESDR